MNALPLHGVRVIDFSWIIAGPTAGRFLALMGAEVIKVGSARRPDPSTKGPPFQVYNQSKMYSALNLSKPDGIKIAKELVSTADVVLDNFAAGVIERMGLGYSDLIEYRPDLVMISSSGTGHTGPDKDYVAYGSLLQFYTGWNSMSGYPNREPIKGGLWADPWVGMELAMVTVAALNNRLETGVGQYIDYSMAEGLTATLPESLIDYQMNGRVKDPIGNDDVRMSPHGAYPCKGKDRWIAIAVSNETEWHALCNIIGRSEFAKDPDLNDAEIRRSRSDEIDEAISAWSKSKGDYEAMLTLQNVGIAAGPSLDSERVYKDPQLRAQGFYTTLKTSDGVTRDLPGLGWKFDGGPESDVRPAPVIGQHNDYVYHELMGLPESEINTLIDEQIIY